MLGHRQIAMRLMAAAALCAVAVSAAAKSDYAREKKWADEITPGIVVGDPIYLAEPDGHKFLAIYAKAANPKGAVVTVHGIGVHPDWGLINVLRSTLPDAGYTTLSVQMPILEVDAKPEAYDPTFPEAAARLAAAVAFLHKEGYARVAIVSHSMGSRMANYYLVNASNPPVAAWVALGLSGSFAKPQNLKVPVLDLYGEKDLEDVLKHAPQRAKVVKAIPGSGQEVVAGADHFYAGHEQAMVDAVKAFLARALAP
jgi:pimeloyl-ACP methyl ester carboxylesterase